MTESIKKTSAPNSVAVLILGILASTFGVFYFGLILGIIGLVLANKGNRQYKSNPELYDGNGMLIAGKIFSILGIISSSLLIIYTIIAVIFIGSVENIASLISEGVLGL